MKQELDQFVGEFKGDVAQKPAGSAEYELALGASITYSDANAINFEYVGEMDNQEGRTQIVRNFLFNRKTDDLITVDDIIKPEGYPKLSREAIEHARVVLADKFNQANVTAALAPNSELFKYFEIKDADTIYLVFQPGDIADKSVGFVKVPIQLSTLGPYLKREAIDSFFALYAQASKEHAALTAPDANDLSSAPMYIDKKVDCKKQKCIAITFDDGPGKYTNMLLDVLKQNNSHATFFMVGLQVLNHPDTVKRAYDEGNEIGNHTWGHVDVAELSNADFLEQTSRTNSAIADITGKRPIIFRPPYGSFNNPTQIKTLKTPFILWSKDSNDWHSRNADAIYTQVMAVAKPNTMILSHDIYDTTVEAYKKIIPALKAQGYQVVTVSELLGFNPGAVPEQMFNN